MRLVSTSMLRPDMVLAKSIYHRDCLILKAGQTDLSRFVSNLNNMGIEYVFVEDGRSEGITIPDAISEKTRHECKKVLRQTVNDFYRNSTMDFDYVNNAANQILDDIMTNPEVQVSLNDISATDEYTFSHSVSTTVYSLLIARQLGYSQSMMEKLATGTLLHDMGKVLIEKSILLKESALTADEFEHIKKHTILGYELLKKCSTLTELSRIISLSHHERMDGSGYPRGIMAGKLHEFARIVAVADVYDALTTNRCYRKKWTNEKAVNYLIECSDTKFDTRIVANFIQTVAIYPNGSMVRLSNKQYAIVKEQNRSMPLRPIVRVVSDENGYDIPVYEIDLLKELSLTVIETEVEIQSKKPIFEIDK